MDTVALAFLQFGVWVFLLLIGQESPGETETFC